MKKFTNKKINLTEDLKMLQEFMHFKSSTWS